MKLMQIKIKTLVFVGTIILGLGFLGLNSWGNAYAEDVSTALTVSPMSQRIILVPGETYTGTINIVNGSNAIDDLNYSVEIGSYNQLREATSKDDYDGFGVNEKTSYNLMMDWTKLDKSGGVVAPNNKDVVTFTIKVPQTAPAGAQYMTILVVDKGREEKNKNSGGMSITSKVQLASAIFANVAGETVEKGSISENNMPSVLTSNKLEATSMVRNDGNIYTDATYTLQVWPLTSDEELCTNEEKAETSMVLPNTERYHVQTCDLPTVGIFRAKQVVKIFGEESVLEKTIFVCPIWLMILAIVIVVAIIAAIIIIIKKNKAKKSED